MLTLPWSLLSLYRYLGPNLDSKRAWFLSLFSSPLAPWVDKWAGKVLGGLGRVFWGVCDPFPPSAVTTDPKKGKMVVCLHSSPFFRSKNIFGIWVGGGGVGGTRWTIWWSSEKYSSGVKYSKGCNTKIQQFGKTNILFVKKRSNVGKKLVFLTYSQCLERSWWMSD